MKTNKRRILFVVALIAVLIVVLSGLSWVQNKKRTPIDLALHVGTAFIRGDTSAAWKHLNNCEKQSMGVRGQTLVALRSWTEECGIDWSSFDPIPASTLDTHFLASATFLGRTFEGHPISFSVSSRRSPSGLAVSITPAIIGAGVSAKMQTGQSDPEFAQADYRSEFQRQASRLATMGIAGLPNGEPLDNCEIRTWQEMQDRNMELMFPDTFGR